MTFAASGRSDAAFEAPSPGATTRADGDPTPRLRAVEYHSAAGGASRLRITMDEVVGADHYLLERTWGLGPESLEHIWGSAFEPHDGEVVFRAGPSALLRGRPFTVGFTVRAVFPDGRSGPASPPHFVSHPGGDDRAGSQTPEHLMLGLLLGSSFFLWQLFRREQSHEFKIRLAAATALSSLMFLSVTGGMSWSSVADPSGDRPVARCQLGDEVGCATYVIDAGPDPIGAAPASAERRFELERWMSASTSLRVGLVLTFITMLPALIWLAVAPRVRGAQVATCVGASCAAFTVLAVLFYRFAAPGFMPFAPTAVFDLALIASCNIVVAAALVVRSAFALLTTAGGIPAARALRRG